MPNSVSAYMTIRRLLAVAVLIAPISFLGATMLSSAGWAQTQASSANAGAAFSSEQLDELVGPIALYPDELLAITLPASTYPLEIVQAARYLEQRKSEPERKPNERWDSSVLGLLNYPDIVERMNQDLDWTARLGDAVVNQQQDLMDAIQRFRTQANSAGNLRSDERVTIVQEKEIIKIESASPEVIYVPAYNPTVVVVQQPAPYTYVYSQPYPYYYNPAATFWTGMFVGAAIGYGIGWHGYGHNDININRNVNISGNTINRGSGNKWSPNRRPGGQVGRPATRPGSRPGAGSRAGVGSRPAVQPRRDVSKQASRDRRSTAGGSGQARRQQSYGSSLGNYRNGRSAINQSNRGRHCSAGRGQSRRQTSYGGSFGNYQNGRSVKKQSNRGRQSRASQSNYRTSKSSRARSSGGRSRRR